MARWWQIVLAMPPNDPRESSASNAERGRHSATELEDWLIGRVVHALGNPSIHVDADSEFSRLALDSITAVRITGELQALLGRPVDAMLVWDYRTIREAAAHLAEQSDEPTTP